MIWLPTNPASICLTRNSVLCMSGSRRATQYAIILVYGQRKRHSHGLCDSHADRVRNLKIRVWGSQKGSIPQTGKSSGTTVIGYPLCSKRSPKRGAKSAVVGPVNGHGKCSAWALQTTETRLLKAKTVLTGYCTFWSPFYAVSN